MTDPFRCATSSEADAEPLAGTAPTETDWLLVEHPGPWGRKAVAESRLPADVAAHLGGLTARVQLVRRPGRAVDARGVRVYSVSLAGDRVLRGARLDDVREVVDLADADLTVHDGPLWLVCTNGRRDVCCAERGRPIAASLAETDPDATWETTHLGGHRFAGTLLALPSGVTLGRLDTAAATAAVADLRAGRMPVAVTRGRAGWSPAAQHADLQLRREHGWTGLDDVALLGVERAHDGADVDVVVLETPQGRLRVAVRGSEGPPRRQSCADTATKPTRVLVVESVTPAA